MRLCHRTLHAKSLRMHKLIALYRATHQAAASSALIVRELSSATHSRRRLFDCDCNLTHSLIAPDVKLLLKEAASAANLKCLITPGSSVADSFTALDVANDDLLRQDTGVEIFSTFGIHPYEAKLAEFPESFRSQCRNVVMNNKRVVALGECGLDLSDGFPALQNQLVYFRHQLDIACELQLPLFLHERAAHDFFMKELMLRKSKLPKLLVHCFTGTAEELQKYLDFGCYISISGIVARDTPDAEQVRNALKQCSPPADRLLIETDAPYLPFPNCRRFCSVKPKKTSPNVPSAILGVAQALSLILGRPIDSVCHDSFYAATSFFGIQDI